jgi:DNA-binding NtrC family response regulator/tetratricopeptide (TPR) repeat protein
MTSLSSLIGTSPAITEVREQVLRLLRHQSAARRPIPMLILGETGSGKSVLARAMHGVSPRSHGPFVAVNCAAIPETLVEAELFGVEKGAFTDAGRARPGLFQAAHRGTLFLDEVGALPLGVQAKLLVAVEERRVRRLGSTRDEPTDAWIVAATSEDLAVAVRERRYRDDLYQRLAGVTVTLAPLRERGNDILLLAEHFLARAADDYGLPPKRLSPDARAALIAYPWPGNIRELANLIERAALLTDEPVISAVGLALRTRRPSTATVPAASEPAGAYRDVMADFERSQILAALEATEWNLARAAAHLGIPRNTLRYRIEKHGLKRSDATPASAPSAGEIVAPPLAPAPPRAESSVATATTGERRLVTFLQVDVAGSETDGESTASEILGAAAEKVRAFAGRVEDVGATKILATFGLVPPEEASARAVFAALAIARALHRERDRSRPMSARLALHVAHCLVGADPEGATALDPADAQEAREVLTDMTARAGAAGIVASSTAIPLIERRFSVETTSQRDRVHGRIARVLGREATGLGLGGRALSRFVGRDRELATLIAAFGQVEAGHGQVIGMIGEPGAGKSRLLYELRRALVHLGARYVEGRCFSHGSTVPYAPVVDLIRHACDVADDDDRDTVVEKVKRTLGDVDAAEDAALVLHFMGVTADGTSLAGSSSEALQARMLTALRGFLLKLAGERPLFVGVEDVHWIDPSSEAFLADLVDRIATARIFVVTTYRPGYEAPWVGRSYVAQLPMTPLSPESSLEIVRSVLGTEHLPDHVTALILPRAGGNPFFIEELAWSLKAQADAHVPPSLPGSVHEVLLARIDRLPADARELLRVASVLSAEFPLVLLEQVHGPGQALDAPLAELVRREFFTHRERGYRFKHALTQEVAYASLPVRRRRELHAAAAAAVERLHAGRLDDAETELAHHYAEAEDVVRATDYLARAAARAERRSSYPEAIAAVRRARSFAERLPGREDRDRRVLELVLREVHLLHFSGLVQDALELLLTHRAMVERLADPAQRGPYAFWLARTYSIVGDRDQMETSARHAIELAERCGDGATGGKAHFLLAFQEFGAGRAVAGLDHAERATALLTDTRERWWLGMTHWTLALNLLVVGRLADALAAAERLRSVGQALEDARLLSYAAWTAGWVHVLRGDWARGVDACGQAFELAQDPVSTAYASGHLGFALAQAGDVGRAIPMLEEAINQFGQFRPGSKLTQARFLAWLSEAYLIAGDSGTAESTARRALDYGAAAGHRLAVGIATRALGLAREAGGDFAEAARFLHEAREHFTDMPAPLEVALTDVALAQLGWRRGERSAADGDFEAARRTFRELGAEGQLMRAEKAAGRI